MMKSVLIFSAFVFFPLNNFLFSQTPPYYHYTSIDGLASSTVYDIFQDSKGYIWCATANGISRFDGHRFKNYGIKDGLNSNVITVILEGNEGEIYFANYEKGINKRYYNGFYKNRR
jgi:ligand-binding sensor domain-containing protein